MGTSNSPRYVLTKTVSAKVFEKDDTGEYVFSGTEETKHLLKVRPMAQPVEFLYPPKEIVEITGEDISNTKGSTFLPEES